MKLLNLGCGGSYHPSWTNIDFVSSSPDVKAYDLQGGIPSPDSYFDVVYHSHLLEHFAKKDAQDFVGECSRVLKSGGVLRIVVPDLESIVKCYLNKLDESWAHNSSSSDEYDWIMLEMYDQVVRNKSGGEMASFLKNIDKEGRSFIRSRIGQEADNFWISLNDCSSEIKYRKFFRFVSKRGVNFLRELCASWLVRLIAGKRTYENFRMGCFRGCGEVHQWMYDRYSLVRLLRQAGFVDVKVCTADESRIPDFGKYSLDVLGGSVRKPDSLYVEAVKP